MRFLIVPLMSTDINSIEFKYSDSFINCVNSIRFMDLTSFDKIYFVLYQKTNEALNLKMKILADVKRLGINNIEFVVYPLMTDTMAETVMLTLAYILTTQEINDFSFFVKDGDNSITLKDVPEGNYVTVASLENLPLVEPVRKSYINVDEYNFITNIIEKKVISDKFVAGGYSFEHAKDYLETYNKIEQENERFRISDIIYWMILFNDIKFMPVSVDNFNDFNIL